MEQKQSVEREWTAEEQKRARAFSDACTTSIVETQSNEEAKYWEEYFAALDARRFLKSRFVLNFEG